MTDTMIEKMALSVARCLADCPTDESFTMADCNGWTEEKAYEIARAALLALRDGVTEGMKAAGAYCGPDHDEEGSMDDDGSTYRYLSTQGAEDVLRAILNHVLQEGEKDT